MAQRFEAVHDFQPITNGEIELRQGDVVLMNRAPPDPNEWWNGTNTRTQQVGYFPGNYVKPTTQGPPSIPPRPPRGSTPGPVSTSSAGASAGREQADDTRALGDLRDQTWYWGQCSRDEVNDSMRDRDDGYFLVRDAMNAPGQYTLTLRKAGVNKLIRILHKEGKYGFSLPLEYSSVPQLIHHFKVNSLSHYNSGLDICLTVPLPRPLAVRERDTDDGDDICLRYNETSDVIEDLTKNFELDANKKKDYVEKLERITKIQTAQQDILNWLQAQTILFDERFKMSHMSSPSVIAILDVQSQGLRDQLKTEQKVSQDLEIKQNLTQSTLRKIDNTLKTIKLDIKDKSRILLELDRQLRVRGLDPDEERNRYNNEQRDYTEVSTMGDQLSHDQASRMDTTFPMETYLRQGLSRENYRQVLLNKPDGTFLIRPSIHNPGQFTLDIVVRDEIKKVSIIHESSKYGLVSPTTFSTITMLVDHYRRTSLREHNRQLDTKLIFPAFDPRFHAHR